MLGLVTADLAVFGARSRAESAHPCRRSKPKPGRGVQDGHKARALQRCRECGAVPASVLAAREDRRRWGIELYAGETRGVK